MSNDDKEKAADQLESKWQSRHGDEREIPVEQRKAEARLLRKVDWLLIPILGILYSIVGLDRVNLSNARVAGMDSNLRFDVGDRYSIARLIFFVAYFLFEMPTTPILRCAGPKLLLNSLVFSWGCVMLGMGFANDWRVIVRYEVQQRMALWYMINLFVSVFGNILAYAFIKLDGAHGIVGWRWIFIIEGAVTIGFAFLGYAFTLPFPDQLLASGKKSTFSQDDLQIILERVERDRGDAEPDALTFRKGADLRLCVFIQIILTTLGYGTAKVFLLCAPPYLFSIIWTLTVAWCADRSRLRMPWMVLNAAITLTGLTLMAYHDNNAVRYFGVFLGVSGCNGNLPTIIASLGGIYASCTFMQTEYPTYRTGVWCAVATQFLLIVLVGLTWWWFKRQNKKAETQGVIIQEDADYRYTF
ncbi:uncharacterized protein J7T54_006260 [Emericellopsis cladophorae]|uniref:Major facilitator superfamily (MFS) profile domain-containing protein n=1 Tax=Emericellopsis cladophorae TaxID=2686198 RepID=A0A9P9Y9G7_9HYPO|nr:uncharacterized protein J7T54_006260 [Emericellopsis cladophorae]KAI6785921.1 hypothetical protein J7T54_006260 [Emericellopsis cladophorae]